MMPASQIFAALRWWIVLLVLGVLAFPLTYHLLGRLPSRGYAFSKMVGLLLVSYIFWLLANLGFLGNNLGGIIFSAAVVLALSLWALVRNRSRQGDFDGGEDRLSALQWVRVNWRYVLVAEAVFTLVFVTWTWVRAQNPAISATEKPMEFAFLNSAGRSPSYPPLDPWLSGFAISYYYFGYVMTSVVTRLAAVPEQIGFNLAVAWLAAGTALGAFGLVYDLVLSGSKTAKRSAVALGLVAAIALPIAGNMEIFLELLHGNGVGADSFWIWLDVRDLEAPAAASETPRYETTQWWWWRSSRVIHEYRLSGLPEEGLEPIAEFPGFSFVLGDLHPHVLALPFAFLSLAVALSWWSRANFPDLRIGSLLTAEGWRRQLRELGSTNVAFVLFTGLVLGGLSFLNTWDVLIHLFVILGAFVLALWRGEGQWRSRFLGQAVKLGVLLVAIAVVFYLPFYLGFRSQAGAPFLLPMTMRPTRLTHYLIIFAVPLISITVLLLTLAVKTSLQEQALPTGKQVNRYWLRAVLISLATLALLTILLILTGFIVASSPEGATRIQALASELGLVLPSLSAEASIASRLGWAATALATLAPSFLGVRLAYPALTLLLLGFVATVLYLLQLCLDRSWSSGLMDRAYLRDGGLPFALLLIGTATLLSLGPEFLYLKDNFGQRLNTVFKFYYQAWLMFGVAALFGLDYLRRNFRISGIVATFGYGLGLAITLLFPWYAIQSRAAEYRGPVTAESRSPATLNGLDYMNRFNGEEYEAIEWLRENIEGTPVILEAVGGQYSGFGRIAASTGLPTVLGWAGHEYQWRGDTPEPGEREPAVQAIYNQLNWSETAELLDRYQVDYVIFGSLERNSYDPRASEKFDQHLEVAYRNDNMTIYRWLSSQPD